MLNVLTSDKQRVAVLPERLGSCDVSVVMPAFNESEHIEAVVENVCRALSAVSNNYELVVIDDGSNDGTFERLTKIAFDRKQLKVIRKAKNGGKGAAVKSAADYVTGKSVVVIDSDKEISPSSLRNYLHELETADICIASKRHPHSVYDAPSSRKFWSIGFNKMVRILTGIRFDDTQTGLKAVRGDHFARIMRIASVKRYAYDVEFLAIASLLKLRVAEMPVEIHQKAGFRPRDSMLMFLDLLGISYRLRIKKWYQQNLHNQDANYRAFIRI
jgi:dolichyl-phosphate beta-glucosyltransferase